MRPDSWRCRPIVGNYSVIGFLDDWEYDQRTAEANARLIAKAPEMAELLMELVEWNDSNPIEMGLEREDADKIKQLLASIEGKDG